MIEISSIDLSLSNIWKSWFEYRKGKNISRELNQFQYYLEKNLYLLFKNLNFNNYRHGSYQSFTVSDNKKREICVAGIRDRVVHRLLYDYLVGIFDKTFIYDVWSCREDKGLIEGLNRAQTFLKSYPGSFVLRADIKKFFDSVNHEILLNIIMRRVLSS